MFHSLSQWTYFLSESKYTFNSLTWTENKKKFCETDWIQWNCVINLQGFLLLSKGYLQYIKEQSHFTRKGFEPILTKQLKEIIILCLTLQLVTHPRFVWILSLCGTETAGYVTLLCKSKPFADVIKLKIAESWRTRRGACGVKVWVLLRIKYS